ncbi:MAG: hypothetical protein CL994_03595 [Euryarchaeota archaeon]|nr:hypothetical protein [Euryarchaeota archaeon]HAQ43026.1 hypothetical protein [Acidimicrobiaceae bacterium]
MRNVGRTNRTHQLSYSKNARLYGDPGEGSREVASRLDRPTGNRNVVAVEPMASIVEIAGCLATTKAGDPCKARPAEGETFCTFHKE